MTLNEFRNALNIMTSIDLCELEAAGIRMSWGMWESFSNDPAGYFVRAGDDDVAKLWSIIDGLKTMTPQDLAGRLNGSEYPMTIARDLKTAARKAGLVIVFGASDDLMEFEGAIDNEIGACGGITAFIDRDGLIPDFDDIDKAGRDAKEKLRNYFQREFGGKPIKAIWDTDGYSWIYETEIPHVCFDVMEEGKKYCRGIVFRLADLGAARGD